jgi:hypothetical protein
MDVQGQEFNKEERERESEREREREKEEIRKERGSMGEKR